MTSFYLYVFIMNKSMLRCVIIGSGVTTNEDRKSKRIECTSPRGYIRATAETVRQYKYRIKSIKAIHVVAYIDQHPRTITGLRHII
jgi:hypothetical protein